MRIDRRGLAGTALVALTLLAAMLVLPAASSAQPPQPPLNGAIAFDCSDGGICAINPDGSGFTQLAASGEHPRWSPDGSLITYDSGGVIYVMNANGSGLRAVTPLTDESYQDPSFSFDGQEILFDNAHGGLYEVPTTSTGAVGTAISVTGVAEQPAQSPDGSSLAFDNTNDVVVSDDGAQTSGVPGGQPEWSPDGSLVYFQYDNPSAGYQWEIDSMSPDGSGQATVIGGDAENVAPSPDGTKLAYYQIGLGSGVAIASTSGAGEKTIPNTGEGDFDPAWQPTATVYQPTLSSVATSGQVGTAISDTVTLSGAASTAADAPANAGGTITVNAYSTSDCSGTPSFTATATVDGNGSYATDPASFSPTGTGTYYWTASYSGDAGTDTYGASEGCGATNETSVVGASPGEWSGGGSASEPETTTVVSDGTSAPPEFSYDVPASCGCGASGSWTFETAAATAGQVVLPWSYAGSHGNVGVSVGLSAFVTDDGQTTTTPLVSAGPTSSGVPSGGFAYSGTSTLSVQAGDTYGFTMSGANSDDADSLLEGTLTVDVAGNDAWTRAQQITLDEGGDGSARGSLDLSGQARWYKFDVTPGGSVQVNLSDLPANYDLTVFSDIGQAYTNLTSGSLQADSADFGNSAYSPSVFSPSVFSPSVFSPSVFSPSVFSPSVFSPSVFSPSVFSPSVFSPSVFSPSVFSPSVFSPSVFSPSAADDEEDYEGAQTQSLLAVSDNPGTEDENAYVDVWNNTGSFYIRVNGANGTYDPGAKFSLSVHENTGTCGGVAPDTTDPLLSSTPPAGNFQTLILTDYDRMTDDGGLAAMKQNLASFAALPSVDGTIAELDQISPALSNSLYAQADAHSDCPYAENLVADAIRNIVLKYRSANPSLKYVVIVGNDHVIPFFRYPDTAGIGPESDYIPPVLSTSPSEASLASDDVLSEDAYGATTTLDSSGLDLPVPDLPVGRLVDTPTEISGMLAAYGATNNGVVSTPTSSLVTGYDFMTRAADAVESDFQAGLAPGATNDTLISADGVSPSDTTGVLPNASWTADQLRTSLLGSRHDLIFLAGHFSANNTLAADFSTTMDSTELADSNVNLENAIVFSAGCHSGYGIVGNDAVPNVTVTPDWVEAFAQKQATLIAGTGYQYGDTDFLAYSEQLYVDFANQLLAGSGPVPVGEALVQAKENYLDATPNLQGIDVKSLLEATLYGLPMLSVDMPDGRDPAPASPSIGASTAPFTTDPGKTLGLSSDDVTLSPSLTPAPPVQFEDGNGQTAGEPVGSYLTGPSGVETSPAAPTLPLATYDAGVGGGNVLRGVGFLGGSYSDTSGITPVTGAPGTDLNGVHSTFASSAFYPSKLWTVDYFPGLTDANGDPTDAELMLTPAQYESDSPGSATDTQRKFSSVKLRLFYSSNFQTYGSNIPALAAPPTISRVDASSVPGGSGTETVNFALHVVGDPAAGIQQVWVTYNGVNASEWDSLFLSQDATDSTLWTGQLTGLSPAQVAAMQFIVQAANGVGLVSMDNNEGSYYQVNEIPAALQNSQLTATTLTLDSPPSSGGYGAAAPLSATFTGPAALAGQQVTFSVGGSTISAQTNASGVATVDLPLIDNPGSYELSAGFPGSTTLQASAASSPFTITALPTTLTIGGGSATGVTATLASGGVGLSQHTVAFELTPGGGGAPVIQTRLTGLNGVASLGFVTTPLSGSYTVQAFFGPGSSAPPVLSADPIFQSSASGTTTYAVAQPTVTSILRASTSPTSAASVSWAVSFSTGVTGVSASNFTLIPGGGLTGAGAITVTGNGAGGGSGTIYTVTASTGTGSGTLGLNLGSTAGISASGTGASLANTLTGQIYTIGRTSPSATISFPANGGAYRATTYAAGCTKPGICGTAADPAGVASVTVSIENSANKYWNGSSFAATSEALNGAALAAANATTSAWSYPFALPANGSYRIHVKTVDLLGNGEPAGSYAATASFVIDTVNPTISFTGAKTNYGLLDTVGITCTVADPAPSSGLKTNPCAGFSIAGPAWSFKPGLNTLPSPALQATDNAGNSSPLSTVSFTVTPTAGTLCQLSEQFVEGSAKYAALSLKQRQTVAALATALCTYLSSIKGNLSPSAKAPIVKVFDAGVQALVKQGWLTAAQAGTLTAFAGDL